MSHGPFRITEKLNEVTFRLALPKHWRINNAFHTSLLKHAYENDDKRFPLRKTNRPPPHEVQADGTMEYEVDKIVDKRKRWNRTEYRVRWKGYSPSEDTWETTKTLYKVKNLIADYEENKLNMPQENLMKYRSVNPVKKFPPKGEVFVRYRPEY